MEVQKEVGVQRTEEGTSRKLGHLAFVLVASGLVSLAAGLFLLGIATLLAGGAGLGAFVLGAVVQTSKIRRKREARARAAAAAAVPPPPPTPPPPR